jgi:hypothetical protein
VIVMQYLLNVHIVEGEPAQSPEGAVERVNAEMRAAGAWVFGGGLLPSGSATVVRADGGTISTTDGPYAETKEQIGGFWVIRCADLDEALAWAGKCTRACGVPIEVRPFDDESGE